MAFGSRLTIRARWRAPRRIVACIAGTANHVVAGGRHSLATRFSAPARIADYRARWLEVRCDYTAVSVVVIGRNEATRLERCLSQSPQSSNPRVVSKLFMSIRLRPTTAGVARPRSAHRDRGSARAALRGGRTQCRMARGDCTLVLFLDGDTISRPTRYTCARVSKS